MLPTALLGLLLTFAAPPDDTIRGPSHSERELASDSTQTGIPTRHRPSLSRFVIDLLQNSAGLLSSDNVAPLLLGVGASAAAHPADQKVANYFASADRFGVFTNIGTETGRTAFLFGVVGGLWSLSHFYGNDTFVGFSHDLAQASALNGLLTQGLKRGIGRTRPDGTNKLSMPSGHSSATFAAATVIDHYFGTPVAVLAYAGAGFVAASRLDSNKHYLSDVVAGAALGHIVGRTVLRRRSRSNTHLKWTPVLSPETETLGVVVYWTFDQ